MSLTLFVDSPKLTRSQVNERRLQAHVLPVREDRVPWGLGHCENTYILIILT